MAIAQFCDVIRSPKLRQARAGGVVSAGRRSRDPARRALVAAAFVLATLAIMGSRTNADQADLHATRESEKALLSVHITSPLGRLGLPGAIRIVAQLNHPPQL